MRARNLSRVSTFLVWTSFFIQTHTQKCNGVKSGTSESSISVTFQNSTHVHTKFFLRNIGIITQKIPTFLRGVPMGGLGVQPPPPPRNSEVLPKLSRIPSSVEYTRTSVTTWSEYGFHSFANWVEPLTRGLPPPDPHSPCPLSSTQFAEPPRKQILGTPLTFLLKRPV
jgi:hypothetical protein